MIAQAGLRTPLHRPDWTTSRLKFIFDRKKRSVCDDDGVVTAFRDGVVTLRSNRREDGFTFADKEIGYQGVEPGDLVIHAMDGFAGAIGVSDSRGKCSPVYTIAVPKTKSHTDVRFWAYYLRNLAITGFIESLAKGIRERSTDFRWADAGNLLVNFPSGETQREIADFLDRETAHIEQLIEKKMRLAEVIEEKIETFRDIAVCKGLSGHVQYKDSFVDWFGMVPAHWTVCRFNRLISSKVDYRGRTPEKVDDGIFLVTARNIRPGKIDYERSQEYTTKADWEKLSARGRPRVGDILFTTEAPLGNIAQVDRTDVAFAQRIMKFRANEALVSNNFLAELMMSSSFQRSLNLYASGSTASGIKSERMAHLFGLVPPAEEQEDIVQSIRTEVKHTDAVLKPLQHSIERLAEFRSALITAAVTGQIDVETWKKRGHTDRRLDGIQEAMGA